MRLPLASLCRSLALRWPLMVATAFLVSVLFLIGSLYSSQIQLRRNADARFASIGAARAAEIGDFFVERRQAALRLATSDDISNYFSNLDLGMSVRYGLFANLAAIERRFKTALEEDQYRGHPSYLRLTFIDETGATQVDVGDTRLSKMPSNFTITAPNIQIDETNRLIFATAPVQQKGRLRGAVQTVSDLNLLASMLPSSDFGQPREFLLGDDGEVLLPIELGHSPFATRGLALAALPAGLIQSLSDLHAPELNGYWASRWPLPDTRLSILRLANEDELYGHVLSPRSVLYLGLVAIGLFLLAIGFERMRQNAVRLNTKFIESNRHRAELADHNLALSQEIVRRQAIEIDLQRKSDALDKTNAELRIAAAAFNSQEGMIVTDNKGAILSAN